MHYSLECLQLGGKEKQGKGNPGSSSDGWSTVLIVPRLWVQSLYCSFQEVESVFFVHPFQVRILCNIFYIDSMPQSSHKRDARRIPSGLPGQMVYFIVTQDHRRALMGKDLWRLPSPNLPFKAG